MLLQTLRNAAELFIDGQIDEREFITKMIIACGDWTSKDDSITDVAFIIQKGDV